MNPWDDIPSIWDGWEKQCRDHQSQHYEGVEFVCAERFLIDHHRGIYKSDKPSDAERRRLAVEEWIRKHGFCSVISANDKFGWTPDQFRDLDRRLEWEYQQAQLGKQIDGIQIESTDGQFDEIVPRGR